MLRLLLKYTAQIQIGLWILAFFLSFGAGQAVLVGLLVASMLLATWVMISTDLTAGFVTEFRLIDGTDQVLARISPLPEGLLDGIGHPAFLPDTVLVDLNSGGPAWVAMVGQVVQRGSHTLFEATQVASLLPGFVLSLVPDIPAVDPAVMIGAAVLLLILSRVALAGVMMLVSATVLGIATWTGLVISDMTGQITLPEIGALVLSGFAASFAAALGLRVGVVNPFSFAGRLCSALSVALLIPVLQTQAPMLGDWAALLPVLALLMPRAAVGAMAGALMCAALSPEPIATLVILMACLALPDLWRALLRAPRQLATLRTEPRPRVTSRGAFDWTDLLEGN